MAPKSKTPPSPPGRGINAGKVTPGYRGRAAPEPPVLGLGSKLFMEFFGTFLLCFTVAVAVPAAGAAAPLAIGATLMCAVYAGGHISGANYNPAVTLAIWIRGKLSFVEFITYMLVQLIAGCIAGNAAKLLVDDIGYPGVSSNAGMGALTVEVVLTFALCHTVLHVATTDKQAKNSYYGLAIGFTVLSGAVSVGGISGGAFNPAVGVLTLVESTSITELIESPEKVMAEVADTFLSTAWVSFAGPFAGGALAGVLFLLITPSELGPDATILRGCREAIAPFVIEIIGTFLLCFTVATAASPSNTSPLVPVSIGAMLMGQVYAGGATSGANYNPAVTLAIYVRKSMASEADFPLLKALGYMVAQVVGAVGAACVTLFLTSVSPGYPKATVKLPAALGCEVLGTFFLVFVVLQTATSVKVSGNSFFGLAIGATVSTMAVTLGGFSGGAFNPAVGLLGLSTADSLPDLVDAYDWVYTAGPLLGGLLGALAFRVAAADEFAADGYSMV